MDEVPAGGETRTVLSEAECWRLLGEAEIGRLALAPAGSPDIFPVTFTAADLLPLVPWLPTLKYRWVRIVPTSVSGHSFVRGAEPARY